METIWPILLALIVLAAGFVAWELFIKREEKVVVSSWGDLEENNLLINLIGDFRKKYPGIQVSLVRSPYNKYVDDILNLISRDACPDVIFIEVNNFADFYLHKILEPLDRYVETDHLKLADFYPSVLERFTLNGHPYVIPRDTAPWCLVYYNKDAFDESGVPYPRDDWNWDQFVETAKKLTRRDSGGSVTRWGFIDDKVLPEAWVFGAGGNFVDNAGRPTRWTFATDPKTLQGVQFRWDLIHKHQVTLAPSRVRRMEEMEGADMFIQGETAMYRSGLKWTPRFREIRNFKWDVVMLPKGPQGTRAFATGGSGYGLSTHSRNKKAAWKLISFLTSAEAVRTRAAGGLAQPALKALAESPIFIDPHQDPHNKKILLEAVSYSKYYPLCRNWREVERLLLDELDKVWNGQQTPVQAMEKLRPALEKNPPQWLE